MEISNCEMSAEEIPAFENVLQVVNEGSPKESNGSEKARLIMFVSC